MKRRKARMWQAISDRFGELITLKRKRAKAEFLEGAVKLYDRLYPGFAPHEAIKVVEVLPRRKGKGK